MPFTPGMPLNELLSQLTAEENAELDMLVRTAGTDERGQTLYVRKDGAEAFHRHLVGMALSGHGQTMLFRAKCTPEPGAEQELYECLFKALQAFLKARAADPSQPTYVLHLAECLELAGQHKEAVQGYETFILEQSRGPIDPAGQELILMAREKVASLKSS